MHLWSLASPLPSSSSPFPLTVDQTQPWHLCKVFAKRIAVLTMGNGPLRSPLVSPTNNVQLFFPAAPFRAGWEEKEGMNGDRFLLPPLRSCFYKEIAILSPSIPILCLCNKKVISNPSPKGLEGVGVGGNIVKSIHYLYSSLNSSSQGPVQNFINNGAQPRYKCQSMTKVRLPL